MADKYLITIDEPDMQELYPTIDTLIKIAKENNIHITINYMSEQDLFDTLVEEVDENEFPTE